MITAGGVGGHYLINTIGISRATDFQQESDVTATPLKYAAHAMQNKTNCICLKINLHLK
jgi:hypothetical protein